MFSIECDPDHRLMRVQLIGFATAEEVQDYARQKEAAIIEHGWGSGAFDTLIDATSADVQSQTTVDAFIAMLTKAKHVPRRSAIVFGSSLARLQTKRMVVGSGTTTGLFSSLADAKQWLLEDAPA